MSHFQVDPKLAYDRGLGSNGKPKKSNKHSSGKAGSASKRDRLFAKAKAPRGDYAEKERYDDYDGDDGDDYGGEDARLTTKGRKNKKRDPRDADDAGDNSAQSDAGDATAGGNGDDDDDDDDDDAQYNGNEDQGGGGDDDNDDDDDGNGGGGDHGDGHAAGSGADANAGGSTGADGAASRAGGCHQEPVREYSYSFDMNWSLKPDSHVGSDEPLAWEMSKEDAQAFFAVDPKCYADASVRDNSHKRVDITKSIPKRFLRRGYYNPTPFFLGVRAEGPGSESFNKLYFRPKNGGPQRETTYFSVLYPNTSVTDSKPYPIFDGSNLVNSKLAKKYAHLDSEQMRVEDIELGPSKKAGSIRIGSAYLDILHGSDFVQRNKNGKPIYPVRDGKAILPHKDIFKCVALFDQKIRSSITHVDLSTLKFTLHKLSSGSAWDDLTGTVYSALDGDELQEYLGRNMTVSFGATLETTFPILHPPDKKRSDKLAGIEHGVQKTLNRAANKDAA